MFRTSAGGDVFVNVAQSVSRARRIGRNRTRVDTMSIPASSVLRTVVVDSAFYLITPYKWIAVITGRTFTTSSMIGAEANGITSAGIAENARIQAFAVVALFVVATIAICFAARFNATELRVSPISRFAVTGRMMIGNFAFGIRPAVARRHAQFINARFATRAIRIGGTSHSYCFYG